MITWSVERDSGCSGTAGGLGYPIRRDVWGQGLATDIGAALVSWHLIHAADCPLYGYVAVDNPASRRVLNKHWVRVHRAREPLWRAG